MRTILILGNIALKESLRGHVFWGILVFLILFLIFCVYIGSLSLGDTARVVENSGMLGMTLVGLLATILFGLFSIYQEKERNELYALLYRISRPSYVLGRFLGTTYVIAIFCVLSGSGIFILTWVIGQKVALGIFLAVYLAVLEFTLLTSISLLFYAMGFGFMLNSFLTLAVYFIGHSFTEVIESLIVLGADGNRIQLALMKVFSCLFPNFDMFNFRLPIVHQESIAIGELALASLYWLLYLSAVLAASAQIMNRKDI